MTDQRGSVYQGRSGQWAFLTHRITGFLVFLFLLFGIAQLLVIDIDRPTSGGQPPTKRPRMR